MVNKKKVKGTTFENEVVSLMNKVGKFRRVVGSGAFGTQMGLPELMGDVTGEIDYFPKKLRIECKSGYNRSTEVKSFTFQKEWIDKIREEAKKTNSFPALFCKFDNIHSGTKVTVVLDVNDFLYLISLFTDLQESISEEQASGLETV